MTGPDCDGPDQGDCSSGDPERHSVQARPADAARRVVLQPGGPMLVEGPVEVVLPDGETVYSDRFMVALCACRRSRRYPWCDTSHRRRSRSGPGSVNGDPGAAATDNGDPGAAATE